MRTEFWTPSGIRLRAAGSRQGAGNWLFLPGGPGIGSESLAGLVAAVEVPGASWLVDLPGDGSNTAAPGGGEDPIAGWPGVLLEAARSLPGAVFVGHSTGGMYLLSVPELEAHLTGLVLVSSAPHAGWLPAFAELTRQRPLELLGRMPYNADAVDWSARNFDETYESRWWPTRLPTLIVSGTQDRIVDQALWEEPQFGGTNVLRRWVDSAAHFPWIEQPTTVRRAFHDFVSAFKL